MLHRISFLFPEPAQAQSAAAQLRQLGVPSTRIHAIAREGVDLSGLPPATDWQRRDISAMVERVLWDLNLGLFGLFALVFAASVFVGGWGAASAALILMGISFGAGYWFVTQVPHAHIDDCRDAIEHGEVMLLVDLPRQRVHELQNAILEAHPEAVVGVVGWAMESLPI